jgi:hypothetical protein
MSCARRTSARGRASVRASASAGASASDVVAHAPQQRVFVQGQQEAERVRDPCVASVAVHHREAVQRVLQQRRERLHAALQRRRDELAGAEARPAVARPGLAQGSHGVGSRRGAQQSATSARPSMAFRPSRVYTSTWRATAQTACESSGGRGRRGLQLTQRVGCASDEQRTRCALAAAQHTAVTPTSPPA